MAGGAVDGRGRIGEGRRHLVPISSRLQLPVSAPPGPKPVIFVRVGNRTSRGGIPAPGQRYGPVIFREDSQSKRHLQGLRDTNDREKLARERLMAR
jgi:hypothetical protein